MRNSSSTAVVLAALIGCATLPSFLSGCSGCQSDAPGGISGVADSGLDGATSDATIYPDAGPTPCQTNLNCRASQICQGDTCVPYTGICTTTNDCRSDSYCKNGQCTPYDTDFPFDPACVGNAPPGLFVPDQQCKWSSPAVGDPFPAHRNVFGTPMVVDFNFDNDAMTTQPSIVFVTFPDNDNGNLESCVGDQTHYGIIRVIDGATCTQQAVISTHVIASAPVALGDLNGDNRAEIVAHKVGGGTIALTWQNSTTGWQPLWNTTTLSALNQCYWSGPSIHDLDNDGNAEVLQGGIVYSHTGQILSETAETRIIPDDGFLDNDGDMIEDYDGIGYIPVVADLDGDGRPELTDGAKIFEWDPTLNGTGGWTPEVLMTGGAGQVAVADFGTYGANSSADQLGVRDGQAEIVVIANRKIRVMNRMGRVVFGPIALPIPTGRTDGGFGGPPTIADFDGDQRPEISVAGAGFLTVFDLDCKPGATTTACPTGTTNGILWSKTSQDVSSNVTGAAVFDFEGDGRAEVVYADECFTRVYDGQSGEVYFSKGHTSCTWYENPVIVDSDNDGHAEIVVPSNDACHISCPVVDPQFNGLRCLTSADCPSSTRCLRDDPNNLAETPRCRCNPATANICGGSFLCGSPNGATPAGGNVCLAGHAPAGTFDRGIEVLRDRLDRWVKARPVWNQHAYSITNVNDNGTIPRTSQWQQNHTVTGLNNFRQNIPGQASQLSPAAPDLTVARATSMCLSTGGATLAAEVCNRGGAVAKTGTRVVFYRAGVNPSVACDLHTQTAIQPGTCAAVSCFYQNPPGVILSDVYIRVDDDGTATRAGNELECYEGNNEGVLADVGCGRID